jgi:hypothetical protein
MKYSLTKKEEEKGANTDVSKTEDLLVSYAGIIQTESPPRIHPRAEPSRLFLFIYG